MYVMMFSALVNMIKHPLDDPEEQGERLKVTRRSLHFMSGGGQPIYGQRRKRFKGWQRENRKYKSLQ